MMNTSFTKTISSEIDLLGIRTRLIKLFAIEPILSNMSSRQVPQEYERNADDATPLEFIKFQISSVCSSWNCTSVAKALDDMDEFTMRKLYHLIKYERIVEKRINTMKRLDAGLDKGGALMFNKQSEPLIFRTLIPQQPPVSKDYRYACW